ncbi:unnamed protein product [Brassica napus]|uniref:(rape) hypothetical protein n=1 Tax=Brassica napus TaxID=3708 RepID=A0A816IYP0_BRANA|nr:unnamed protein product [Brassica napus]
MASLCTALKPLSPFSSFVKQGETEECILEKELEFYGREKCSHNGWVPFAKPLSSIVLQLSSFSAFRLVIYDLRNLHHLVLSPESFSPKFRSTEMARGDPIEWVSNHRYHHKHRDTQRDPHSPIQGFWFSHITWISDFGSIQKKCGGEENVNDLVRQPFYRFLQRTLYLHLIAFGFLLYIWGGMPFLVWGMRTVLIVQISASYQSHGFYSSERTNCVSSFQGTNGGKGKRRLQENMLKQTKTKSFTMKDYSEMFSRWDGELEDEKADNIVKAVFSSGWGWEQSHWPLVGTKLWTNVKVEILPMKTEAGQMVRSLKTVSPSRTQSDAESRKKARESPGLDVETMKGEIALEIDDIYVPLLVKNEHWVAFWISIPRRRIVIWDSDLAYATDAEIAKAVNPIAHMLPYMLRMLSTGAERELYTVDFTHERESGVPQNKQSGDCGVYCLKYIECHALGMPFPPHELCDKKIKTIRSQMASEIFDETRINGTEKRDYKHLGLYD